MWYQGEDTISTKLCSLRNLRYVRFSRSIFMLTLSLSLTSPHITSSHLTLHHKTRVVPISKREVVSDFDCTKHLAFLKSIRTIISKILILSKRLRSEFGMTQICRFRNPDCSCHYEWYFRVVFSDVRQRYIEKGLLAGIKF